MIIPQNFNLYPEHKQIFESAVNFLMSDERVKGVYLSGSFSSGKPDKYSDIDLYIVVSDNQLADIVENHSKKLSQVGGIITQFPATHLNDPNMIIVFYEGNDGLPIHVDFNYVGVKQLNPKAKNKSVTILLDKEGVLEKFKLESENLTDDTNPTVENLQYFEDRIWGWIWYTYSKVVRGELWEAHDAIEYMRSKVIVPLIYYSEKLPSEGYRRVETKFTKENNQLLVETIPDSHSKEGYTKALNKLLEGYINLFDRVCGESKLIKMAGRNFVIKALTSN